MDSVTRFLIPQEVQRDPRGPESTGLQRSWTFWADLRCALK